MFRLQNSSIEAPLFNKGDFKTTSLVVLASIGEAIHRNLLLNADLAPGGFGSEVIVTSLLAQDGIARSSALVFALR